MTANTMANGRRVLSRALGCLAVLLGLAGPAPGQIVEYYHLDALGSVRAISNEAGEVIERHNYLPFGEEWEANPTAPGDARKFTGKERDTETGLDYFGARYYTSGTGRFTTVDPVITLEENLIDPQRWNRYAYVRNNPLRYTDSDGRAIDIILDIAFIGYDLFDIGRSLYRGEGVSGTQLGALGGDVVGAAVPFATGIGAAIRAGNKIDNVIDVGRGASHIVEGSKASKIGLPGGPKVGSDGGPGAGRVFSGKTKDAARAENPNCVFCGTPTTRTPGPTQSNIDHAIPKARGGNNTVPNAQHTCRDCNQRKRTKTTREFLNQE
jgi:RHS repeat-associated protein